MHVHWQPAAVPPGVQHEGLRASFGVSIAASVLEAHWHLDAKFNRKPGPGVALPVAGKATEI